ncbi:SDR family oxidoreductase [Methylorubrum extorquens]|uniref:SDR family oxidoreductase n=1 Tax=Methylorubrum extorquens TaxID=408 RepID=UPI000158FF9D|nr:SDR family oxidoreductase [Methylorubrum extorquens]ABY32392.1 NmrA family protein [Methylorubrum extorquens PA1]KQP95886.1 NAD(P)-dependent oxidoreductase [Methylobacterium sp. Leaf119]WIU38996.1 SDR family oxidoreductase [Methylorubrum extorquens]
MSTPEPRLFVTGATGQLGRLVIEALLKRVPADSIVAGVRSLESAAAEDLRAQGVTLRMADYARPETLVEAFRSIDRLLLISSSEIGQRVAQHQNVIQAARQSGVNLIAYTSLLRADTSPLALADEHRRTEDALKASGLSFAVLRNGWYTENYAASIAPALAHGVLLGSAGEGRIASAARADFAEASAVVLTTDGHDGRVYELAGDDAYTLDEFAAAVSVLSGQTVVYRNLTEAEFKAALVAAGLPEDFAALLADSDMAAAQGGLNDTNRQLSRLIGRPTTPYRTTIAGTISGMAAQD